MHLALLLAALAAPTLGACVFMAFEAIESQPALRAGHSRSENVCLGIIAALIAFIGVLGAWGGGA